MGSSRTLMPTRLRRTSKHPRRSALRSTTPQWADGAAPTNDTPVTDDGQAETGVPAGSPGPGGADDGLHASASSAGQADAGDGPGLSRSPKPTRPATVPGQGNGARAGRGELGVRQGHPRLSQAKGCPVIDLRGVLGRFEGWDLARLACLPA